MPETSPPQSLNRAKGTRNSKQPTTNKAVKKTATQAELCNKVASLAANVEEHSNTLTMLQDVPQQLNQIFEIIKGISAAEPTTENDSVITDNDPISSLISRSDSNGNTDAIENDADLINILNMTQPIPEYGDDLQADVAESLKRIYLQKPQKEILDKYRDTYKVPGNCKILGVPRVNTEIWPSLSQKIRQGDCIQQQQHHYVAMTATALGRIAEKIFTSGDNIPKTLRGELLQMSMEASTIIGLLAQEINSKRKQDIKPTLHKEFAGICSNRLPSNEWLFGDNITEQLKASKSTASIVRSSVTKSSFRGQRFAPYKSFGAQNLNWKNTPPMRGGNHSNRNIRGRPSRRGLYQSSQQYQK